MKRVAPSEVRGHRLTMIVESNRDHSEISNMILDLIWKKLDRPGEDAYIVYSKEIEPEDENG